MNVKLEVRELPDTLPDDVLIEHIGYALKQLDKDSRKAPTVRILEKSHKRSQSPKEVGRAHPFDGPEMFDDYDAHGVLHLPRLTEDDVLPSNNIRDIPMRSISESLPKLTELLADKRQH